MKGWNIYKIIFLGLVLLAIYIAILQPDQYLKLWFVILWSMVAVVTISRLEVRDWLTGNSQLRLSPAIQLILAFLLVCGAILVTEWDNLSIYALMPWAYTLFALPSYREGYAWGWSQLRAKMAH